MGGFFLFDFIVLGCCFLVAYGLNRCPAKIAFLLGGLFSISVAALLTSAFRESPFVVSIIFFVVAPFSLFPLIVMALWIAFFGKNRQTNRRFALSLGLPLTLAVFLFGLSIWSSTALKVGLTRYHIHETIAALDKFKARTGFYPQKLSALPDWKPSSWDYPQDYWSDGSMFRIRYFDDVSYLPIPHSIDSSGKGQNWN